MKITVGFLAFGLGVLPAWGVANIERYDVNKAVDYTQTSPSAPTIHASFNLEAFIQPVSSVGSPSLDGGTGATLTHSGGTVTTFNFDTSSKEFSYQQNFPDQASLDAAFVNGVFDFAFATLSPAASYNPSMTLTGDNYPSLSGGAVPFFTGLSTSDFSGGQLQIDNSSNYTFNWNAFTGATFNPDEYVFQVIDLGGAGTVDFQIFQSATTSHSIAAGTLTPGNSYIAQIWHRDVNVNTGALGAPTVGQTSYISRTTIPIAAVPEPSATLIVFGCLAVGGLILHRRQTNVRSAPTPV